MYIICLCALMSWMNDFHSINITLGPVVIVIGMKSISATSTVGIWVLYCGNHRMRCVYVRAAACYWYVMVSARALSIMIARQQHQHNLPRLLIASNAEHHLHNIPPANYSD